jgi:short-subunit dehydrogenase
MAASQARPLAIVTGASSGIGLELAKLCAQNGFDLVLAADEPEIHVAAETIRRYEVTVDAVQTDLSTMSGVDQLVAATQGRPVDALLANAGRGLGGAFLDQEFDRVRGVVDTNLTGTLYLIHQVGRSMRAQRQGRILITGSTAGYVPGTYQAVYGGTTAFLDSFAVALRHELREYGVTVTCLIPGPTETEFFKRAGLMDTKLGTEKKQPAGEVAKVGFEAMMRGEGDTISGIKNKLQAAVAKVMPADTLAGMQSRHAMPGTALKN